MANKFAVVESPFAGKNPVERRRNVLYAQAAMRDAFKRGFEPFASHLLYPGTLDDDDPAERQRGIEAGFAVARQLLSAPGSSKLFYVDRGFSKGMLASWERSKSEGPNNYDVEVLSLGSQWDKSEDACLEDVHLSVFQRIDDRTWYCAACDKSVEPLTFATTREVEEA